ncbi:Rmf/CrpP fold protein [Streptomyces sp. CC53]|uniref:Rmf/CrpP fold protein n=1 Tax=Streptomyces sp. CC53 TaxID=1906740 RepID=UPI0015A7238B|nr:Rmf/CrpP fold protein [Streptomyces sp. CC53]
MGTREEIVRAVTAGREAGDRGDPPTACPYPLTSTLSTAWIRGYAERRPTADQDVDD